MQNIKSYILKSLLVVVLVFGIATLAHSQSVLHHPDATASFDSRMDWAFEQASGERSFWVGYAITRQMKEHNTLFVGHSYSTFGQQRGRRGPSLEDVLAGRATVDSDGNERRGRSMRWSSNDGGPVVDKDVAIMLRYSSTNPNEVEEVMIGNVELSFDLDAAPIYWLGSAGDAASIKWLAERFVSRAPTNDTKEHLVAAVGVHQMPAQVVPFMRSVLQSDAENDVREATSMWLGLQHDPDAVALLEQTARTDRSGDVRESAVFGLSQADIAQAFDTMVELANDADDLDVREQAVFWIGQRDEEEAVDVLEKLALNDPNEDIREKAVFALSQLDTDEAVTRLIQIARNHRSTDTREKAIFWLGQIASERAVEALGDLVENDESTEVQKQAVFALSQLDDGEGIEALVEISKTHPSPSVRKDAIFWLGQSGDPRALEAIEALLTQE